MNIKDLTFRSHYVANEEISRVVFSNGHWAAILYRPAIEEYEVYSSIDSRQYKVSEVELSVILSELRISQKFPLKCPWDIG